MTEKRFVKGYCCGNTGLVDKEKEEWFVENINSISDSERNWNDVLDKLNEVADENEQLKQEVTHWKKILDDHQQIVAKTLREQYHWLKNEDKISNHDKTVALLELESISARLGIDLN